ncbi:MAG TPA: BON domain-containing protein [Gemmataceae bacterium]|nr:BON domain-containing protein [Gemmataceae bacterium]
MEQDPKAKSVATEIDRLAVETGVMLRGRLAELRLELRDGGVVLSGTARSFYAKQLAQHAVMNGTDVPIVRNVFQVV